MNEDKVLLKLVAHDEQLKKIQEVLDTQMVIKDDLGDIKSTLDVIVTTVKKISDDHVAVNENVKRTDTRVDAHDVDIKNIKVQLKMA